MKAQLLAAGTLAALLTACSGGGTSLPVPSSGGGPSTESSARGLTVLSTYTARDDATGTVVHIYPTRETIESIDRSGLSRRSTNLTYHGGPVQTAPHLYVVFWGSAWSHSGDPSGVASRLTAFYRVIGGSRWLNSVSQYTQSGGKHVGNAGAIYKGSYVDSTSTPPGSPSQSQMAAEAVKAAAHFGDYSASASYVVAMPHGVKPSGFGTQYCAYHSSINASRGVIAWTNLPYMPDAGFSCGVGSVNSPGTLDGVTIVGGHEQAETETDPQPDSGWLDGSGAENGDKCAWTNLENNPNAGGYSTQPLWSNATSGCVQRY